MSRLHTMLVTSLFISLLSACDDSASTSPQRADRGVHSGQDLSLDPPERDLDILDQGVLDRGVDQDAPMLDSGSSPADAEVDPVEPQVNRWETPLVISSAGVDQALGVDCLPDHSLVVAGRTEGNLSDPSGTSLGNADGFIALIDDDQSISWIKQLGTPDVDQFLDVIYHPQDVMIAGGLSTGDFGGQVNPLFVDGILVALRPDGEVIWQKLIELGTVNRLIPTPDGVVVVGSSDQGMGDTGAFVAEYDLDGERRWLQVLNSPSYDSATSATLVNEMIYVSGFTTGSIVEQTTREHTEMFIAALSLTGEVMWVKEYGTDGDDSPVRISHDERGLIVAGYTSGLFGSRAYGDNDIAIFKTDFNGELIWKAQWGTEGSEAAYGLSLNSAREIILSGRIDQASWDDSVNLNGDAFIMKLSPEGQRLDVWQYGASGRDEFVDLCLSQDLINAVGYIGGEGEDLDLIIDRRSASDAER